MYEYITRVAFCFVPALDLLLTPPQRGVVSRVRVLKIKKGVLCIQTSTVDNLIIFAPFQYTVGAIGGVMALLNQFGEFSGLKLNLKKKTVAIVQNQNLALWLDAIQEQGIAVRD